MTKLSYSSTGVDIKRGDSVSQDAFLQLQKTFNSKTEVFGNIVALKPDLKKFKNPYLSLAADGVGTKLEYIFGTDSANNVGIDVVAMCVNDLARNNIKPLGFALYRAAGKFKAKQMSEVVAGVVEACLQADCVYSTGESAEMPGIYNENEFDLAGFALGIFEKNKLLTGEGIKKGDVVIGLASSGLHSNGFSLVRKIFPPKSIRQSSKLYQEIIKPTKIYVETILGVNKRFNVKGWAHITGSGLFGKLGKILPKNLAVELEKESWPIPDIFLKLQEQGQISEKEMFNTFNMGIGFAGIVSESNAEKITKFLKKRGEQVFQIGTVARSTDKNKVYFRK